jgi:hypothetical protein
MQRFNAFDVSCSQIEAGLMQVWNKLNNFEKNWNKLEAISKQVTLACIEFLLWNTISYINLQVVFINQVLPLLICTVNNFIFYTLYIK